MRTKKTPALPPPVRTIRIFDPNSGVCPVCGENDGYSLDRGRSSWLFCSIHKKRWRRGENVEGSGLAAHAIWERNGALLRRFEVVEPVYPGPRSERTRARKSHRSSTARTRWAGPDEGSDGIRYPTKIEKPSASQRRRRMPPPKSDEFDAYWGVCPTCKRNDGYYLDIGRANWFYCSEHQVRWCIGDLFGSWRHLTEADFRRNIERIGHYQCIEPEKIPEAE